MDLKILKKNLVNSIWKAMCLHSSNSINSFLEEKKYNNSMFTSTVIIFKNTFDSKDLDYILSRYKKDKTVFIEDSNKFYFKLHFDYNHVHDKLALKFSYGQFLTTKNSVKYISAKEKKILTINNKGEAYCFYKKKVRHYYYFTDMMHALYENLNSFIKSILNFLLKKVNHALGYHIKPYHGLKLKDIKNIDNIEDAIVKFYHNIFGCNFYIEVLKSLDNFPPSTHSHLYKFSKNSIKEFKENKGLFLAVSREKHIYSIWEEYFKILYTNKYNVSNINWNNIRYYFNFLYDVLGKKFDIKLSPEKLEEKHDLFIERIKNKYKRMFIKHKSFKCCYGRTKKIRKVFEKKGYDVSLITNTKNEEFYSFLCAKFIRYYDNFVNHNEIYLSVKKNNCQFFIRIDYINHKIIIDLNSITKSFFDNKIINDTIKKTEKIKQDYFRLINKDDLNVLLQNIFYSNIEKNNVDNGCIFTETDPLDLTFHNYAFFSKRNDECPF